MPPGNNNSKPAMPGDAAGFLSHFTCRYLCLFLATQPPL
ncbi:hypothetical protein LTSEGIV_2688 [Salmonella enterica subsp. enterica serovar Give str. S5-487]|nr:hypothetical protein LTSEGIV_2688 [Salmonella enterica subsp. enterica serovar Give str. S5-487]